MSHPCATEPVPHLQMLLLRSLLIGRLCYQTAGYLRTAGYGASDIVHQHACVLSPISYETLLESEIESQFKIFSSGNYFYYNQKTIRRTQKP